MIPSETYTGSMEKYRAERGKPLGRSLQRTAARIEWRLHTSTGKTKSMTDGEHFKIHTPWDCTHCNYMQRHSGGLTSGPFFPCAIKAETLLLNMKTLSVYPLQRKDSSLVKKHTSGSTQKSRKATCTLVTRLYVPEIRL